MLKSLRLILMAALWLLGIGITPLAYADTSNYSPVLPVDASKPFQINAISLIFNPGDPTFKPIRTVISEISSLGANAVKLVISAGYYDSPTDNLPNPSVDNNPSDAELVSIIRQFESAGIAVILNPFTNINVTSSNLMDNVNAAPANFNTWIAAHTANMVHLAQIGQQGGAYGFIAIGDEVQNLTQNPANEAGWLNMISSIRSVFSGQLTSMLTTSGRSNYGDGTVNNISLTRTPIINALDTLGIGWFPEPLTEVNDPTVYQLLEAWNQNAVGINSIQYLKNLHVTYGKPIWISDIAFHSFTGDNTSPSNIFNASIPLVENQQEQANEYQSLIMALSQDAGSWFQGVCFDNWNNYPPGYSTSGALRFQNSIWGENIQGKLAETVLRNWYHTAVFVSTPLTPTVKGNSNTPNFLSGGEAATATLIGGDQGDTFIAGPGQNTILGGARNDTVYARPANWKQKNILTIGYVATNQNATTPLLTVIVNGITVVAATPLTSNGSTSQTQRLSLNIGQFSNVSSLTIQASGLTYVDNTHYSNVIIDSINYNGYAISLRNGTWSSSANKPGLMNNNDTAVFSASSFQSLDPQVASTTSNSIDGGGGRNTVIYPSPYASYTIAQQSDGTWLVNSANTAEGPDTLKNIQALQFSDRTVALDGWAGMQVATPQTGIWWNPAESGRGFLIETSGNNVFLGTFLYDDTVAGQSARATWYQAGGSFSGDLSFSGTLTEMQNGQTLTSAYKAPATRSQPSTVQLRCTEITKCTLTWKAGTVSLERLSFDGTATPTTAPETGLWWNPAESGRGFLFEQQGSSLFGVAFMYDDSGNPVWYLTSGAITGSTYQGNLLQYSGGQTMMGTYRAPTSTSAGTTTVQFQDKTHATITLPGGKQVSLERFRF